MFHSGLKVQVDFQKNSYILFSEVHGTVSSLKSNFVKHEVLSLSSQTLRPETIEFILRLHGLFIQDISYLNARKRVQVPGPCACS